MVQGIFLFQQESARATVPTTLTLWMRWNPEPLPLPNNVLLVELAPVDIGSSCLSVISKKEKGLRDQLRQSQNQASLCQVLQPHPECFQVWILLHRQCVLALAEDWWQYLRSNHSYRKPGRSSIKWLDTMIKCIPFRVIYNTIIVWKTIIRKPFSPLSGTIEANHIYVDTRRGQSIDSKYKREQLPNHLESSELFFIPVL